MNTDKELNRNKFRIKSNPYMREIIFERWSTTEKEWMPPADSSEFSKPEFIHAALYHKAYDIIKTAKESYAGNVGLDIYFEGTADEFKILNDVVNNYFSDSEIEIIKGDKYLLPVREVKRDIDQIFRDMEDMFSKFPSNPAKEKIDKYNDVMSDTIPICVMGLYSTGKSAFINSLLGVEILPSAKDPTTAKTFRICVGPRYTDYSIEFDYQDEKTEKTNIKIEFSGDKFVINKEKNLDIVSELNKIGEYGSEYDRMYHALSILNSYDREYSETKQPDSKPWRVSPFIKVSLPLENKYTVLPVNEYDFVIYDTPGSDASNDEDIKILKEAMREQTNGLPIYVITPEQMDKKTNSSLIKILNNLGDSLDGNNLMLIVNKADDLHISELEDTKKNFETLAVSQLNPAGTYFISSIMGLGSKMLLTDRFDVEDDEEPKFINRSYLETFEKNTSLFDGSKSEKRTKHLYLANIVSKPEYDRYEKSVKSNTEAAERILYNSGLHSVGYSIAEFAGNYSLYNKCRNAGEYLQEALKILKGEIASKKAEKDKLSEQLEDEMDQEKKCLLDKIEEECRAQKGKWESSIEREFKTKLESYKKKLENGIPQWSSSLVKLIGTFGRKKRREFTNQMEEFLKQECVSEFKDLKNLINSKWLEVQESMKEVAIKIIVSSPTLTQEQKSILKTKIINIQINSNSGIDVELHPQEVTSGIFWYTVKVKALTDEGIKHLEKCHIRSTKTLYTKWSDYADNLKEEIEKESIFALNTYNPEILKYQSKISQCSEEISFFNKQQESVSFEINEISRLTRSRIVEKDEN